MSKSLFEMDIMRKIMRGRTERITHCQMLEDFFFVFKHTGRFKQTMAESTYDITAAG